MANEIRDLGKVLRNLVHIGRIKKTKVINLAVLTGVMDLVEALPGEAAVSVWD